MNPEANKIITNDIDVDSIIYKKSELYIQKIINNEDELLKDDYICQLMEILC